MAAIFDQQITFLFTQDLDLTAHFYEDLLGFELVLDQGCCRIVKVREGAFLGYCDHQKSEDTSSMIITFVTDDVDDWYTKLRQSGVQFEKEPTYHPDFHIYHCFLRDPNGYLLEIQRFSEKLK